jgi:hypothetical protein
MGKIVPTELTSVDGVMQSPDTTDVPFKYKGWIMDFDVGPEGDRFKLEEAQHADALLLGRVTYLVVYGSRRISQALMGLELVDEVRLMVYPVVLGAGDRLSGETQDKIPLRLIESRPFGTGVVNMIHAPATVDG